MPGHGKRFIPLPACLSAAGRLYPDMNDSLRSELSALLAAAESESGATGAGLLAALRALDALVAERGAELPADLAHYLERRSYAKARSALENPDMPHRP